MALTSNGKGYASVKVVDDRDDKTFVRVKQVDTANHKNYLRVRESDESVKDYTEVVVVDYDSPKDYIRVNFEDDSEPTETTSQATFTPEQEGFTDAGGGTESGNNGQIQPASLESDSIEYMGSDGDDLFVIDFGGTSITTSPILVALAGIGIVSCVWNAVTSRYEAVFSGIAAALVLSIGIEIEVTFTYTVTA